MKNVIDIRSSSWSKVTEEKGEFTEKLRVTGGYLYHRTTIHNETCQATMCFVPDFEYILNIFSKAE